MEGLSPRQPGGAKRSRAAAGSESGQAGIAAGSIALGPYQPFTGGNSMRAPTFAAAAAAALLAAAPAQAQQYPQRPITMIVPFAAGGPTDVLARVLGQHMSQTLGQSIVVEDVTGAGGTLGAA